MKKYEFTGETKIRCGITLHRIRALKDFGVVCAGDIGGWIEKESNLSHEGNCWVYGEACRIAVAALRAQQYPAKLDRSRWEGCEHCMAGWDYNDYRKWLEGELGEIRISKDELNIDVGPYWETVKIKFCPYCGRPLTEKAWAELERRIQKCLN